MQPRGVKGASASNISLMEPMISVVEVRREIFNESPRAPAVIRINLEVGINERAYQPSPDRALMIRRVARAQVAGID